MLKFLILFFISLNGFAQTLCPDNLATLPVRSGGRVKPLHILASETLRFMTGSEKLEDKSAVEVFCKLSFDGMGIKSQLDLPIKIEHTDAKKLLGLTDSDTFMPASKLSLRMDEVRAAHQAIKENNSYKKELNKILSRMQVLDQLKAGQTWTLPEKTTQNTIQWLPIFEFITEPKVASLKERSQDPFQLMFEEARADYIKIEGDDFMIEHTYSRLNLFLWSLLLVILGLALTFSLKTLSPGLTAAGLVIGLETAAMVLRILISGRAPITNMYETVMFSGFGALVIAFALTLWKKEKLFLIGGLAYNGLCLMMMKFANNMLDPSISPLVPVLRDNFWLSTHVTTIILSYAALALSWVLANVVLVRQMFFTIDSKETRFQMEQIYTCMKVGVVLLAAGIILGGVWADYSWGRFWGWDPKETWSLIVLLIYMAILHGRYSSWITPARFIPLTAGAFMSVMMAWFGVNYILATGLHSYGFSEGGAIFLGSFFAVQTTFLIASVIKNKKALV